MVNRAFELQSRLACHDVALSPPGRGCNIYIIGLTPLAWGNFVRVVKMPIDFADEDWCPVRCAPCSRSPRKKQEFELVSGRGDSLYAVCFSRIITFFQPAWRNWQTRRIQNPSCVVKQA